jgi:hypothetical protein
MGSGLTPLVSTSYRKVSLGEVIRKKLLLLIVACHHFRGSKGEGGVKPRGDPPK